MIQIDFTSLEEQWMLAGYPTDKNEQCFGGPQKPTKPVGLLLGKGFHILFLLTLPTSKCSFCDADLFFRSYTAFLQNIFPC